MGEEEFSAYQWARYESVEKEFNASKNRFKESYKNKEVDLKTHKHNLSRLRTWYHDQLDKISNGNFDSVEKFAK